MPRLQIAHHFTPQISLTQVLGGQLASPEAWDAMRENPVEASFTIPACREHWEAKCADDAFARRARVVGDLADRVSASRVISYGVGTACLELNLHRLRPDLSLRVSDYAPGAVERLRGIFPEAQVEIVDLLQSPLPDHTGSLTLLYRIDTEFTVSQWRAVLERLCDAHANSVLLVPHQLLTPSVLARELARRLRAKVGGREILRAGWTRTRSLFESIWDGLYSVSAETAVDGTTFFLLRSVRG